MIKKKNKTVQVKTWDIQKCKELFDKYRNDLEYFALILAEDENVRPEVFIKNGQILQLLDGLKSGDDIVDGVCYTRLDIPCVELKFKDGKTIKMAVYIVGEYNNGNITYFKGGYLPTYIKRVCTPLL